ncbi:MAG TPA: hypothetical protein VGV35_02550, partial [Bryobacteraceae bacterium]|nr:hypothetical protein [Bryobacteraceae bacterium]
MKSAKLKINAAALATIALCTVLAVNGNAQCGLLGSSNSRAGAQAMASILTQARRSAPALSMAQPFSSVQPRAATQPDAAAEASIVGLWNTSFLQGGQTVDQGFDLWSSDGMEVLNDT